MKELNVIGTMQLLAACQQSPDLGALRAEVEHHRLRFVESRPGDVLRGHGLRVCVGAVGFVKDLDGGRELRAWLRPPPARRTG